MSLSEHGAGGTTEEVEQLLRRMEWIRAELALVSPGVSAGLRELDQALVTFHREGIGRIIEGLRRTPHGLQILLALADDPVIHALLARYGLTKPDLRTRARALLDTFEPHLAAISAAAELVEATRERVLVRLHTTVAQGAAAAGEARQQIEHALRNQLLECKSVEVIVQATAAASPSRLRETSLPASTPETIAAGPPPVEPGWALGPLESEVSEGSPSRIDTGTMSVLLLRAKGRLHAFINECAHLGLPLDTGEIDLKAGVLTCPWHGFRYECATGKCITAPGSKLDTVPFRIERGYVLVKLT